MEKENFNFYANNEKQVNQALNKIIESKRIGNGSTFRCLGASNHVEHERALNDFYASSPLAGELLLEVEPDLDNIWENACGQGHLAKVFDKAGKLGKATDLVDRGYGIGGVDFLSVTEKWENGDIVTNPPYSDAELFVRHSLDLVDEGRKVCMFLKLTFLEGISKENSFFDLGMYMSKSSASVNVSVELIPVLPSKHFSYLSTS